jgi:hypothetical protein
MQYALRSNTGSHHAHGGKVYNNVAWHLLDESEMDDSLMGNDNLDIMHVSGRDDEQLKDQKIFGDPASMTPRKAIRPTTIPKAKKPPRKGDGTVDGKSDEDKATEPTS